MKFLDITKNAVMDASDTMYPAILNTIVKGTLEMTSATSTYFGFIIQGNFSVKTAQAPQQDLIGGMYFSVTGPSTFTGEGKAIVIEKLGYRGMNQIGGPVEEKGRLCYIDNCSTSIIIPPPRMGDPVFNLLVFPPETRQTMHIHPSIRLGVVFEGEGECCLADNTKTPLKPGMAFYLQEGQPHCFNSFGKPMKIIAFHPDSDIGPTDESHPMLSRTYTEF